MTPKERILTAFHHQIPDQVPVSPGIGPWWGANFFGYKCWDVYLHENPSQLDVELMLVDHFKHDEWFWVAPALNGGRSDGLTEQSSEIIERDDDKIVQRKRWRSRAGDLEEEIVYPKNDPPWVRRHPVVRLEQDWPVLREILGHAWKWSSELDPSARKLGEGGVYPVIVPMPIDWWMEWREGGVEGMIMDFVDHPALMEEVMEFYRAYHLAYLDAALKARPDEICLGGSCCSLSIISPDMYRRICLPMVRDITSRCKAAGVVSHQHTCGRSMEVVQMNYDETVLDVMEPLEPAPGGNIDMADAKRRFGDKLCLKGNLNTFQLLRAGTARQVSEAAEQCIRAGASGGAFMLATGDQISANTPEENIWAMIETARSIGVYDRASGELRRTP
jgi:uroporphyrinogen decarboxylase